MLLSHKLIDKHVILDCFWRLWWKVEANRFNLACLVSTVQEMYLNLFPTCDLIVILLHIITEPDTIKVTFLDILLVDIYEVYLNREASPLAVFEYFQDVLNIVNYTCGQNNCLVKDLRKVRYVLPLKVGLFLLVSRMARQGLEKIQNGLYLDG